jgi:hypothetical protein
MLFQEHWGEGEPTIEKCYVTHFKKKILDSRDTDFVNHEFR